MTIKTISCLLALTLIVLCPLKAQTYKTGTTDASNSIEQKIDDIFSDFDDVNKPGATVAVVKNGEIVFSKGYGSANLEYSIPNSPSTIFHVASVSKQFTVFAVLLLAEEGKLSLDDDIRKFIPEVPDFGKTITLRHLASHTSGLRDQWTLLAMAGWRMDDVITKENILGLVSRQQELNFDPGEEYAYCNTGFTLLAEVVSRVSGQTFAEFTQENIFTPLDMSNTLFYEDHEKIVKNRSYSYDYDDGYKKKVLSFANVGATSLFTTVEDLCLWAQNFSSLKVGNSHIVEQMNTEAILNSGKTFGGALGQFVNTYHGLNQIQHGGSDAGYRSYIGRFPDQDFAVAVLSNYAGARTADLALRVTEIYLKDYFVEAEVAKAEKREYVKMTVDELEKFSGYYWNEQGRYSRRMYVKDDTLRYFRNENSESPLAPTGDGEFQMLGVAVDLIVNFDVSGGKPTMKVVIDDGDPIYSEAYEPAKYSAKDLKEYTGSFNSEELGADYTIELQKGKLVAKHLRTGNIDFEPVMKDFFTGNKWYFGSIEFVRDELGIIQGFHVSSGRIRDLWFKKQ